MEEKRLEIFGVEPVLRVDTEGRLLMSEAVQRAIDARIAKFAAAMEHSIRWSGGLLAESLKTELRKWAPCKVAETLCCGGGCPQCHSLPCQDYCTKRFENADAIQGCLTCHHDHETGRYMPPASQPPLSACCGVDVFEERGRLICEKCRTGCTLK